jgi:protein-S-isoprenylcysteine O-methyltransferase Ste14
MVWMGRPPIPLFPFVVGKLAVGASWVFLVAVWFGLGPGPLGPPALRVAAACLLAVGVPVFVAAMSHLGESLRVGLPDEPTELKTGGLYAYSRNPIYLAVFLICTASCLYAPHPLNIACAVTAIALHHWIVLAEERFLAKRFGRSWQDYAACVRRYL